MSRERWGSHQATKGLLQPMAHRMQVLPAQSRCISTLGKTLPGGEPSFHRAATSRQLGQLGDAMADESLARVDSSWAPGLKEDAPSLSRHLWSQGQTDTLRSSSISALWGQLCDKFNLSWGNGNLGGRRSAL